MWWHVIVKHKPVFKSADKLHTFAYSGNFHGEIFCDFAKIYVCTI